jgi:hypothetical protein
MKKTDLIQKVKERFQNLPQDVEVVVKYKGEMFSERPEVLNFADILKYISMKKLYALLKGEIIQEEQQLCGNTEYQFLNCRVEAPIDMMSLAYHTTKNDDEFFLHKWESGNGFNKANRAIVVVPAQMSLIEAKVYVNNLCETYDIPDCHVLIQSLDYPVFQGMRDRNSPQPEWNSIKVYS